MNTQSLRGFLFYILPIAIIVYVSGCGDMPHSNPLDPKNPNYRPPALPAFTSVAIKADNVWFGTAGGGMVWFDGFKWGKYTKAEGLPDNYVEAVIVQGDNIWFTISGRGQKLYKFDGQKSKEYSVPFIASISTDINSLWIGSENEIGTYDYEKDSLIWYQLPAGGKVLSLIWDSSFVWLAVQQSIDKTKNVEITKFDPQTTQWSNVGFLPILEDEIFLAMALDKDSIWFGTSRGDIRQFQLVNEKITAVSYLGISPSKAGYMAVDESLVWFGYGNRGLIRYHKISGKRESFLDGELVGGIAITSECVWAVTNTGAHCYDKRLGIWKKYIYPTFGVAE